jgi:hypothetical protein
MTFGLTVHENTIHNALVAAGYYHRIAKRRPYLNKRHRKWRLKFAKEHVDWILEQWGVSTLYQLSKTSSGNGFDVLGGV